MMGISPIQHLSYLVTSASGSPPSSPGAPSPPGSPPGAARRVITCFSTST